MGLPLKVDAGARGLAHLDYNDLHITGQLKEEDPGDHQNTKVSLQSDSNPKEPLSMQITPPATSEPKALSPEHDSSKKKILPGDDAAALKPEEAEEQEEPLSLLKSEFPPSMVVCQVPSLPTAEAEPVMDDGEDEDDLAAAVKKKKRGKRNLNRK